MLNRVVVADRSEFGTYVFRIAQTGIEFGPRMLEAHAICSKRGGFVPHLFLLSIELRSQHRQHRLLRFELLRTFGQNCGLRLQIRTPFLQPRTLRFQQVLLGIGEFYRLFEFARIAMQQLETLVDLGGPRDERRVVRLERALPAIDAQQVFLVLRTLDFECVSICLQYRFASEQFGGAFGVGGFGFAQILVVLGTFGVDAVAFDMEFVAQRNRRLAMQFEIVLRGDQAFAVGVQFDQSRLVFARFFLELQPAFGDLSFEFLHLRIEQVVGFQSLGG